MDLTDNGKKVEHNANVKYNRTKVKSFHQRNLSIICEILALNKKDLMIYIAGKIWTGLMEFVLPFGSSWITWKMALSPWVPTNVKQGGPIRFILRARGMTGQFVKGRFIGDEIISHH